MEMERGFTFLYFMFKNWKELKSGCQFYFAEWEMLSLIVKEAFTKLSFDHDYIAPGKTIDLHTKQNI